MTDEQDFAWAFHEEKYKDALSLAKDISEFRCLPAGTPSELETQKRELKKAGSRLDEIIGELMEDTSVPRQMIDDIKASREAAELVEPPQPQVVYAPAAAPATQNVVVQVVVVNNPALPPTSALEPCPTRAAPADQAEPTQAAPVAEQVTSHEQVQAAPAVKASSLDTERPEVRQARRLSRLRELGAGFIPYGAGWRVDGTRGALARLEREEREAGRPMSDKSDIRKDLQAAVEREREGKPSSS